MKKILTLIQIVITLSAYAQWSNSTSTQHPSYISYGCVVLPNNTVFVTGVEGDINQSAMSSLYKSTNGGINFSITHNFVGKSVERIKFYNNTLGLIVTREGSVPYLLKTTDGGVVWSYIYLDSIYDVRDLYILDENTYFITARNSVYISTNGGTTWSLVYKLGFSQRHTLDEVKFLTKNLGFLIAYKNNDLEPGVKTVYRTIDGGKTFVNIASSLSGRPESMYFYDADNGVVLYSDGTIFRTTNGGVSWVKVRTGNGTSIPYFYQMHFINPLVGYAVSQKEIVGTTDGGQTWTSIHTVGANFSLQNIHMNNNGRGIATGLTFGNYSYGYSYGGLTSNVNAATATISGFDSVCNNNTGTLRFDFTGGPPWSVVYSDGVNSYNLNNITSTPYFLPVTVTSNKVFTIKSFFSNGVASANVFGKAYTKLAISNQSAQISGAKTICSGDSTQLIIRLTGSKPVSFTYTDGTTPVTVSGITDSVYRVFVSPTTTKTYSLVNVKDICGNNGSITGSALITVIPAIIAPSNFKLTDNDRKILLEWTDNSSNEDSIIVERKMQGQTSFSRLKVLLPNTIQYLDTNIAYQKWYYYKVTFKKNNVSCIGVSEIDSIYADYPPSKFLVNTLFNPGNSTNIKNAVWFDVDNDGDLDIIFGSMCVYKNNGSGGFEFSYNFSGALLDSVNGSTLRVTDVNNDGRTDYFLLNAKVNGIAKAIVLTDNGYFNMVAGPFDYSNYDNVTWPDNYIDFINYNNDKRLDIIANYYKVINTPFNPYNGTYAGVDVNTTSAQTSPNPNFILQRSRLYDNMTKFGKTFYLDLNNDNFQDLISFGSNGVHVFKFADNIFESKFEDSGVVNGLISNYNVQMSDFDNNLVSEFVFQMPFIKQKSGTGLNTYTDLNANYGDFNSTNANGCKTFAIEDFNNDGWQDVFMTYTNKAPVLFLNNKNKTFSKYDFGYIAPAETKAAELVLGDYDIDGKVDIAIGNRILRNTLPFNNNWINIKLLPVSTNRIPYGARVRIKAIINGQPVWQQREITANGNSTIAHFGLGNAVKIDSIVVLWPNHTKSDSALRSTGISNVTTLQNISTINQQIEIVEPTRVLQFLEFAASVTKASLKWNKISGANNYLLKRRSVKDTAFRQVYIGNNIVFEDTTLLPNSVYEYILYSFSYGDTLKESVYVTTDKIRIKAETTNGLTNIISWNGTESSTIKNMLYRKKANGQFQFVKDVKRLSSYIDTLVMPSEQYCYFIQSFYSADSSNKVSTDTVCVNTLSQSFIKAGRDTAICQGQSVTLTATGASNYSWNNGANTPSITVSPTTTTTYIVMGTVNSVLQKDTVIVTVNPKPTVNAGVDKTICAGSSITLTALGAFNYTWNTGQSTSSITVSPTTTTNYIVAGTSTQQCTSKDTVSVIVNPKPNVNAGEDIKVCAGSSATLTASGALNYTWNTGQTTSSITVTPYDIITSYVVTGTTAQNCSASDTIKVTLNPKPYVNAGTDKSICTDSSVILTAIGSTNYKWNTGATTYSIIVSPSVTTTYIVTGFDAQYNCSSTDTVKVVVKPLPNVAFTKTQNGAQVQFSAPGGNTSYHWSFGDTTTSTQQNPLHTYTKNGKFYVTLTAGLDGCTQTKTDSVTITITAITNQLSVVDKIQIAPNPVAQFLSLDMEAKKATDFNVTLLNVNGQVVFTKIYNKTSVIHDMLDTHELSSGVYLLQIQAEGEQAVFRIIKK